MASFVSGCGGANISEKDIDDGYPIEKLFNNPTSSSGITFDDLIVLPGSIDFGVHEVDLKTRLTKNICLNSPFCSSPMDTVTDHKMAVAMAQHGGVGFLHHNCSIQDQVEMVRKVKRYENGFIQSPACVSPELSVRELKEMFANKGFAGCPVTVDGTFRGEFVGFVTKRDVEFLDEDEVPVSSVMEEAKDVIVAKAPCRLEDAQKILREKKITHLPIVDASGHLVSLTTRKDLLKNRDYPLATKDAKEQLVVGAAVRPQDRDRAAALAEAGVDVIVIDSRNGDNANEIAMIRWIKENLPGVDVIGGNCVTPTQCRNLLEAGADGIRIGMGAGGASTAQEVRAVGRAQLSAVYHTAKLAAQTYNVPVVADGGISSPGCATKALTMGASCVMMGSLIAGTEEAPGDYFYRDGQRYKRFHGSRSVEAMEKRMSGAGRNSAANPDNILYVASGVSGMVVDKGSLSTFMPYLIQAVKHGFQDMGVSALGQIRRFLDEGVLRFELRSTSAQREGGVHDLFSYEKTLFK